MNDHFCECSIIVAIAFCFTVVGLVEYTKEPFDPDVAAITSAATWEQVGDIQRIRCPQGWVVRPYGASGATYVPDTEGAWLTLPSTPEKND